jgi:hypothetical protein
MRTQASPDLCAESKWLIAFDFNLHILHMITSLSPKAADHRPTQEETPQSRIADLSAAPIKPCFFYT